MYINTHDSRIEIVVDRESRHVHAGERRSRSLTNLPASRYPRLIYLFSLSLSLRRVVGGDDNESRPMTSLDHQTVRRLESVSVWEKQRSLDLRGKVAENEKGARIILSAGHGFLRKWRNPLPDIADQRSFSQEGGGGKDGVNEGEREKERERELANETISDYALT